MKEEKTGLFIISLDFELMWGVRDKRTIESYGRNILGVKRVIPSLLKLFTQYEIRATFATVGFLFARNKEELYRHLPVTKPVYSTTKYSPYENSYLDQIGTSEADDPYHFGASLVDMIRQTPGQELASHTFCHYYCLEQASLQSFEEDLGAAKSISAQYGVELESIVFPRNQYTQQHIKICRKLGFTAYRGNEKSFMYSPRNNNDQQNRFIKALRLLDSYLNISGHHTFRIQPDESGIVNIPASRFLRPYSPTLRNLNAIRLRRIKNSMTYAARRGEAFHLWWHPHNFGVNLSQNLSSLEEILQHFQVLHNRYDMQSKTMKEVAAGIKTII